MTPRPDCEHEECVEVTPFGDDHHRWACVACGTEIEGEPIAKEQP